MSRSRGRIDGDIPYLDGLISLSAGADIVQVLLAAEATKLTRIAGGEYSLRTQTASSAYTFMGGVSGLVFRTGVQDDTQEQFGSSRAGGSQALPIANPQTLSTGSIVAGSNVSISVMSTVGFTAGSFVTLDTVVSGVQEFTQIVSITNATTMVVKTVTHSHTTPFPIAQNLFTTPADVGGRPPYTGVTALTPLTAPRPKGIALKGLSVIYAVNTTAITVAIVGLYATQFVNGVAPTVTTLIPLATNNLATAAAANPYVIPVPVPLANQGFIITPNTIVTVEFDFTSGASGSVDVIGFSLTSNFNYV